MYKISLFLMVGMLLSTAAQPLLAAPARPSAAPALSMYLHACLDERKQLREGTGPAVSPVRHSFLFTSRVPQAMGVDIAGTLGCFPRPGEMRMLAAGGFHWVRMNFDWPGTERMKGRYDFHPYDQLLAALRRYHIRLLLMLCGNNPLYDHGLSPATPQARWAFCRWVAAAVRHFRGHGIMWEMWNEPNGAWSPRKNVRAYIKLALAVGKTIRRVAPRELYVGPALADSWIGARKFLRQCFQAGLLNYWDAVTIHPYRLSGPETVVPVYRHVRALIARYAPPGRNIPVIPGEWGYASSGWTHYNAARQGRMLAREFLVNLWQGIPLTIWFDWDDFGCYPRTSADVVSYNMYGIVHPAYHAGRNPVFDPKPAYLAARTLATQLAGCRFVKRLPIGGADDYLLLFHGPQGNRLAAWTTSRRVREVVLPLASGGYRLTNETGAKTRTLVARADKLQLSISHDPEYIDLRRILHRRRRARRGHGGVKG